MFYVVTERTSTPIISLHLCTLSPILINVFIQDIFISENIFFLLYTKREKKLVKGNGSTL